MGGEGRRRREGCCSASPSLAGMQEGKRLREGHTLCEGSVHQESRDGRAHLYGEYCTDGNWRDVTSSLYRCIAAWMTLPTDAYCLQNFGVTFAWCGCDIMPRRSW